MHDLETIIALNKSACKGVQPEPEYLYLVGHCAVYTDKELALEHARYAGHKVYERSIWQALPEYVLEAKKKSQREYVTSLWEMCEKKGISPIEAGFHIIRERTFVNVFMHQEFPSLIVEQDKRDGFWIVSDV